MKILALEFSSERRSVAIGADSPTLAVAAESGGRNTRAFSLIEAALREASIDREEIGCVAVGLGPGSYAGIRAAIALAQGWQLARGTHLLGISTVECLAAQARAAGLRGPLSIAIDAQRNEFYLAQYDLSSEAANPVAPLKLATHVEVERHAAAGSLLVWPELSAVFPKAHVLAPDAAILGVLAASRTQFVSGDKLEPIYLRETAFVKAPPPRVIPKL